MKDKIKLNLGCGDVLLNGYLNIDHRRTPVNSASENFFQDDCMTLEKFRMMNFPEVEEIISFHLIEHLPRPGKQSMRPNAENALKTWFNLLTPGGTLIIECPNFEKVVQEYVGYEVPEWKRIYKRIDNIFGLNRHEGDRHQWGYTPDSIKDLLENIGFVDIQINEGTDYHAKLEPCMRIKAVKK